MGLRAHTGRVALTCIAAAAALAVAAPFANAARGHKHACNQAPAGWISVTDDQGVPWLVRPGQILTACTQTKTAPVAVVTTTTQVSPAPQPSPYPGYVLVFDDQGVAHLEQGT